MSNVSSICLIAENIVPRQEGMLLQYSCPSFQTPAKSHAAYPFCRVNPDPIQMSMSVSRVVFLFPFLVIDLQQWEEKDRARESNRERERERERLTKYLGEMCMVFSMYGLEAE